MDEKQVVVVIIAKMYAIGSLRSAAAKWGVSPAYLSQVVRGNTRPGEAILRAIGYERVTMYRKRKGS